MVLPGKGLTWKKFFVDLQREYVGHRIGDVAGSVTFFAVLALFPFLLVATAIAGMFMDPQHTQVLIDQIGRVAPPSVTLILARRIVALSSAGKGGPLTFGALAAVWAASGGVVSLINALNIAYGVTESRPFWKVRLLALGVTIGAAFFGFIATLIALATPALAGHIGGRVGSVIGWLGLPIAGLLMMCLWAGLYYVLPDVRQKFKFISMGTVVGVLVWSLASWGFSLYVQYFGRFEVTYGALGGGAIFLIWLWITAQFILIGAEINSILEHRSTEGSETAGKSAPSAPGLSSTRQVGGAA